MGGTIGDPTTGQRVKINDPDGKFGRTWTPDSRFTIDENNPTIRSETGYPMCIPRGPAAGGDALCPQANRPLDPASPSGFAMILTSGDQVAAPGMDATLMAPFEVGDHVTYSGILITDDATQPTVAPPPPAPGVQPLGRYIAAFAVTGNVGLFTRPGTDPAYVATDVVILGVGGQAVAGAAEATVRTRFEGFTTDPSRNILFSGIDADACTGAATPRPWGAIGIDPGPPSGAVMGRWRFRPPCTAVGSPTDKKCTPPPAGTFLPPTREMRAAIETAPGSGVPAQPFLVNGVALPGANQYQAPIFEFLFPETAGTGQPIVPNDFESMPFLAQGSGPLEGTGPIVGWLDPWPLGFTAPAPPSVCRFALSVVAAGNGSGTVTPVAAGTSPLLDNGTVITLTATPTLGSTFTGWGGACAGTGTCTVIMSGAQSVTATFSLQQFALSVTKAGTVSGGVTSAPSGINCSLTCNAPFDFGTAVTLTATPALGSVFTGWTGGGCTGTAPCTTTVTAATSVTATFASGNAALTSPTPGSTLPASPSATFTWSAGSGATGYVLRIGTTPGGADIYDAPQGLALSRTVTTLPGTGGSLFVRLYTRFGTGVLSTDYTFTAAP